MQHPSSAGSPLPPGLAAPSVSPQVWLCHHAEVAQQGDSGEAVGAALDQELPVWGAVEEDAPQLLLSPSQGAVGATSCTGLPSQRFWDKGVAAPLPHAGKAAAAHPWLSCAGKQS